MQDGERVHAGDPLIDGPINPHDVLQVLGEKELQRYMIDKIQEVYRSQSVQINDKHIEVIVRQMMRSVKIEEVGDTEFLSTSRSTGGVSRRRTSVSSPLAGGPRSVGRCCWASPRRASRPTASSPPRASRRPRAC